MRIIQPDYVGHFGSKGTRHSIYSLDFQPLGNRLATGAGGIVNNLLIALGYVLKDFPLLLSIDGTLKIWNGDTLLSLPSQSSSSTIGFSPTKALLATLTSHAKSVNCVRWSKDGNYLASASDDNYIMIHKHTPGGISNQSFGAGNAQKNIEVWNTCFTLQGHSMDVLDLDWSVKGILASASIDNKILLWDVPSAQVEGSNTSASRILAPMQYLQCHTAFVKGLSFDPVGRYLISAGSDNQLLVWDCDNKFSLLQQLSAPLKQSMDVSKFKRLSWSPDGNSVCITTACKSGKPVGMVLKRGDWSDVADLVGHTVSTSSSRFCPYMLSLPTAASSLTVTASQNNSSTDATSLVALGDQNGTLTIWSSQRERPLFALKSLFSEAITDLSWMNFQEKIILAISSITGDIIIVDFQTDCGHVLNDESLTMHFRNLYGKGLKELHNKDDGLVTDPLLLKYNSVPLSNQIPVAVAPIQPKAASLPNPASLNPLLPISSGSTAIIPDESNTIQKTLQHQVVSNKNGKKRIRPVLMNVETNEPLVDDDLDLPVDARSTSVNLQPDLTEAGWTGNASANDKDNRKKIRFHDSEGGGVTSTGFGSSSSQTLTRRTEGSSISSVSAGMLRGSVHNTVVQQQILTVRFSAEEVLYQIPLPVTVPSTGGNKAYEIVKIVTTVTEGATPSIGSEFRRHVVKVERLSMPNNLFHLNKHGTALSRVTLMEESVGKGNVEEKELWWTVVSGEVITISGLITVGPTVEDTNTSQYGGLLVAGCADGTVYLLEGLTGMRIQSPFVLGASIVFVDIVAVDGDQNPNDSNRMTSSSSLAKLPTLRLLCLTGEGQMFVWEKDSVSTACSLRKIIKTDIKSVLLSMRLRERSSSTSVNVTVDKCYLHSVSKQPIISLASAGALGGDYQTFQFNSNTECWQRIADSRHFLSR